MTTTFPPVPGTLARPRPAGVAAWLAIVALLGLGCWALGDLRLNLATLVDSGHNAVDFAGRMFPLDFPPVGELLTLCGQTLAIVVSATLLSVLLSAPLAVLAAANTTPGPAGRFGSRAVIVLSRAVPDVVLAIVFFRIFGLGAMTGVLAMGLHSVGMVAKLYADAIEQIDEGPRTAVRAGGAGRGQELVTGVLPQVLPAFVATALHRLDINLRVSVVLGFVGVDGLGYGIATAFGKLDYRRGMALALVVLVLCVLVELISGSIRVALLRGSGAGSGSAGARPGAISPGWTLARARRTGYAALTVLLVLASVWGADLSPARFFAALGDLGGTLGLFWPPHFGGQPATLFADLWITVKIALAATVLGAALALPIGVLAARNVAPSPAAARVFRLLIVLIRGVPELVLAIVFVVVTGLGAVAGAAGAERGRDRAAREVDR